MKENDPYQKVRDFVRRVHEEKFENPVRKNTLTELPLNYFATLHDKKPREERGTLSVKQNNATLLYVFADVNSKDEPYQSLEEIGDLYGLTRERIRQITRKNLSRLRTIASQELKSEYPTTVLDVKRESTVKVSRKMSGGSGGVALNIENDLSEGKSTEELVKKYGRGRVLKSKKILESWNSPTPDIESQYRHLAKRIEKLSDVNTPREELVSEMKKLERGALAYSRGENSIFLPVSSVQQEAWNNKNVRNVRIVLEMLEKAGFPVVSIKGNATTAGNYNLILSRMKDEAVEILKKAPDIYKKTIVTKLGGKDISETPPTSTSFASRKKHDEKNHFADIHELLASSGIDINSYKLRKVFSEEFFQDSPIPVYRYDRGRKQNTEKVYFVNKANLAEFKDFIVDKLSKTDGVVMEEKEVFNFKLITFTLQ